MDLEKLVGEVEALAKEVGVFQMKHFRSLGEELVDMKAAKETVSFVDVESEKLLFDGLSHILPEAGFFGEESGKSGSQDLVWIVDPLDGTTNFLSGIDHFSISIALVKNGKTVLAVLHKPSNGELFTSYENGGVKHNGEPCKPRFPNVSHKEALFVTGFPYRSEDVASEFFDAAPGVLKLGRGIRRTGSAALDLANIAAGWYQGFWETDLQPYDVAAAMLMMHENGVVVTNHKGEAYNMFQDRLMVAALPNVHQALLEVVQESYTSLK